LFKKLSIHVIALFLSVVYMGWGFQKEGIEFAEGGSVSFMTDFF
jgi:hypothetical protein